MLHAMRLSIRGLSILVAAGWPVGAMTHLLDDRLSRDGRRAECLP
jgi:hypothetical protein